MKYSQNAQLKSLWYALLSIQRQSVSRGLVSRCSTVSKLRRYKGALDNCRTVWEVILPFCGSLRAPCSRTAGSMFENLTSSLETFFSKIRGRGRKLGESDVREGLRTVRMALL